MKAWYTSDYAKTIGFSIIFGLLFWVVDGYFEYHFFHKNLKFMLLEGPRTLSEALFFKVPIHSLFVRISFILAAVIGGAILSFFLFRKKVVQNDLRKSEETFSGFFNQGNIGMAIISTDHHFVQANKKLCQILGYEQGEFSGKSWIAMTHPDDLELNLSHFKKMTSGEIDRYEMDQRFINKDDQLVYVHLTVSCIRHADGTVDKVLATFQDITEHVASEQKRALLEGQLVQAQKMESVGRLAGGVAHDYNNILSIIIGYGELALDKVDPDDPLHADLSEILKAAQRSTDITRQLLAFARQQTIAPRVLDLNDTIESMLKMLRRLIGEDIDLAWMPGAEIWPIKIDPSQIDQIMANLCVNARDAIADVGKVAIETRNIHLDQDDCADHPEIVPGEYVSLAVSDDGGGMAPETVDKIFEPFFTTKGIGKGTGLGLATVYGIVKQNNGFIYVKSELGQGTTFGIYLPRHTGQTIEVPTQAPETIPISRGETVLLVEDDDSILELGRIILASLGYTVLSTHSPLDAARLAEAHDGNIDLLITDVVMPGMNGRELSDRIQSIHPAIKILFMSGYTADVIAHRGVLDAGVCFMPKPFSRKELAVKVRDVLDEE